MTRATECYRWRVNDVNAGIDRMRAGLCAGCAHVQRIESSRTSVFYLCRRSAVDSSFAKYPGLPMVSCTGYEPLSLDDAGAGSGVFVIVDDV